MSKIKNIVVVLSFVIVIALTITITRSEFIIQLNKNSNSDLIDIGQAKGMEIDKNIFESIPSEKYLIVYDSSEEGFIKIKDNVEQVLEYTKKEYDTIEVNEVSSINNQYNNVIIILEDSDKLRDIDNLMSYVFKGGNVFFAFRLAYSDNFNNIYRKLGIFEYGEFIDVAGIRLLENILIKGNGLEVSDQEFMLNSSMMLQLTDDCQIFAESINGVQMLWKRKHGQGNILYFNGTMLDVKMNRGFIVGALGLLEEDFIYPIINAKVSFIDDFPSPVPQGSYKKIEEEFGRTISRFYKDIWWPDMLELASKYNIKYTGVIIGTYNNEVKDIKPGSTELNTNDLIYYGRELINQEGEIGIHGYNHQPFLTQELFDRSLGYKPWKDRDTMIDAIEEIAKLSKEAFPHYTFRVYVPPSNILYPEGRETIIEAESDIKIISSLYTIADSKDAYEQEFEVASDGIIEFPRFTSEYMYTSENNWLILNGITSLGCFSHFVHPDDVLDYERTGDKGWSQLLEEYDKLNKQVFNNYRWLRGMTASEGANQMMKYLMCEPKYDKQEDYIKIYCNNIVDRIYFVLRTEKQIESSDNCNVNKIDKDVYLVEVNSPISQINFER